MVVLQQPAESRPAPDLTGHRVVVAGRHRGHDDLAAQSLMVAFRVVVRDELAQQVPQMALAEDQELVEALVPDRPVSSGRDAKGGTRQLPGWDLA